MTGFMDHFGIDFRIVDDIPILIFQFVLGQDGAHALAPSALWFEIGLDFHTFFKGSIIQLIVNFEPQSFKETGLLTTTFLFRS